MNHNSVYSDLFLGSLSHCESSVLRADLRTGRLCILLTDGRRRFVVIEKFIAWAGRKKE
jgi:hypothetical protein